MKEQEQQHLDPYQLRMRIVNPSEVNPEELQVRKAHFFPFNVPIMFIYFH